MSEPALSIVGGGLVAAIVTIFFNVIWDTRKEGRAEDWEFRRYRANLVHGAAFGLMEIYFSAKAEIDYLVGSLSTLVALLARLDQEVDTILRQQGGAQLIVAELERRKNEMMQPVRDYNQQQIQLRWNQYEQKVKELEAKAEAFVHVLQPLLPNDLNIEIGALFTPLTEDYEWNLPNAETRLQLFRDLQPRFNAIQRRLADQIEVQLGRRG
jgi:hypothetical protein